MKIMNLLIICIVTLFCISQSSPLSNSSQSSDNDGLRAYKGLTISTTVFEFDDSITAKLYFLNELKNLEDDYGKFKKNYDKIKVPARAEKIISDFETLSLEIQQENSSYIVKRSEIIIKMLVKKDLTI